MEYLLYISNFPQKLPNFEYWNYKHTQVFQCNSQDVDQTYLFYHSNLNKIFTESWSECKSKLITKITVNDSGEFLNWLIDNINWNKLLYQRFCKSHTNNVKSVILFSNAIWQFFDNIFLVWILLNKGTKFIFQFKYLKKGYFCLKCD